MTSPNAPRLAAQQFARRFRLRVFGALGVLALLTVASVAQADAVDDALAKFLADKFPQTEAAIGELAALCAVVMSCTLAAYALAANRARALFRSARVMGFAHRAAGGALAGVAVAVATR